MDESQWERVRALVEPMLAEQGMELVELTCQPAGGQQLVRILVDTVGGVTIQQCARANQLIGRALEQTDLIEGRYVVEVSSPGLDRPLVSRRDFERALREDVALELSAADGRPRTLEGQVLAVQHEAVVLKTPSGNIAVPWAEVREGKKTLRW